MKLDSRNYLRNKSILSNFLALKENEEILKLYKGSKDKYYKEELIEKFNFYYKKVVVVSYYSKSMYYFAQKYEINLKKQNDIKKGIINNFDKYNDFVINQDYEFDSSDLLDYITDEKLYKVISDFDVKHKKILYMIFVNELSETDIGLRLSVSRQAVNKMKNKIFKKIKKDMEVI